MVIILFWIWLGCRARKHKINKADISRCVTITDCAPMLAMRCYCLLWCNGDNDELGNKFAVNTMLYIIFEEVGDEIKRVHGN